MSETETDKLQTLDDVSLVSNILSKQKKSRDFFSAYFREAEEDRDFVAGHQWTDSDIEKLKLENRPIITFNRVNAMVAAILGIEANQRQEIEYLGREVHDTALSESIQEVGKWLRDYAEIESEEAMAFEDMITTGMGWTETRMDYETDLDGKFVTDWVDCNEMTWDMSAKKRNLSDARWICRSKKYTKDEILDLWPEADISSDSSESDIEGQNPVTYIVPGHRYEDEDIKDFDKKPFTVHQYQWFEQSPIYRAQEPSTGKIIELSIEDFNQYKELLNMGGAKYIKQSKRTYYQAFICGNTLLERGKLSSQTGFTLKCITGKRDHNTNTWYGLVRLMKDPQRWSNKFFSQFLDIINSNAKGGIIAEVGAFSDTKKAEEAWAKADSIVWANNGAMQNGRITNKPVAPYPAGVERLLEFAITSIREVSGINLELMGLADREQAGVLEETRKKSAYAILAIYFDSFRNYRKSSGLCMLEFMIKYVPTKRISQVLSEEYKPYAEMIKSVDLSQIDIIVTESPQSENNKMITWSFMMNILPMLIKMGLPVPPDIVEYSPLPAPLAAKWKKLIESTQADPMKQKMGELEVAQKGADVQKTQADTQLSQAKALDISPQGKQQEMMMEREKHQLDMQAKIMDVRAKDQTTQIKMHGDIMKNKLALEKARLDMNKKKEKDNE